MKEKYSIEMRVIINDPNCKQGMIAETMLDFDCYFTHSSETYGNGWKFSLVPKDKHFAEEYLDLRYTEYNITSEERAKEFLTDWANWYWSGKKDAWKVKQITFK